MKAAVPRESETPPKVQPGFRTESASLLDATGGGAATAYRRD